MVPHSHTNQCKPTDDWATWERNFNGNRGVVQLLRKLKAKGIDIDKVQVLLFVAPTLGAVDPRASIKKRLLLLTETIDHLKQAAEWVIRTHEENLAVRTEQLTSLTRVIRQLAREEAHLQSRPKLGKMNKIDYVLASLALELKRAGIKDLSPSIAALLNAAEIPNRGHDEAGLGIAWSAEAVTQRRKRFKKNVARILPDGIRFLSFAANGDKKHSPKEP